MRLFYHFAVATLAKSVNYEENDMRLTKCQAEMFVERGYVIDGTVDDGECDAHSRAATNKNKKWDNLWNGDQNKYIVPYYFSGNYSASSYEDKDKVNHTGENSIKAIKRNIMHFEALTCVSFKEIDEEDKDKYKDGRLRVSWNKTDSRGCWSKVGRSVPYKIEEEDQEKIVRDQDINLRPDCALRHNETTALHEFMHALGFTHEQNRFDRDDNVGIHPEKLNGANRMQYEKLKKTQWIDLNSTYDFQSIMHYPVITMDDGKPSIYLAGKPEMPAPVKRQWPLSQEDIYQINKLMKCETNNKCVDTGTKNCGGGIHKCVNNPIGYTCNCAAGYQLSSDADGKATCVDINECSSALPFASPCGDSECVNTPGSFSCGDPIPKVHEIVFMIDGTGSYREYRESACKSFIDSIKNFKGLKDERPFDLYRLGVSLYSDRIFTNEEFTVKNPNFFEIPFPLTNVIDLTDAQITDAYSTCITKLEGMHGGGDAREDMLAGLIWTRSSPEMNWSENSIKTIIVATDDGYHTYEGMPSKGSKIPPTFFDKSSGDSIHDLFIFGDGHQSEIFTYYKEEEVKKFVFVEAQTKLDYLFITLACENNCTSTKAQYDAFQPPEIEKSMSVAMSASIADQFVQMATNLIKYADIADIKVNDPNECELGTDNCHPNATCVNKSPGYECTCNDGLIGDGFACTVADPCLTLSCTGDHQSCSRGACNCDYGYVMKDEICLDIDECAIIEEEFDPRIITMDSTVPPCSSGASCHNSVGGFYCVCDGDGWEEIGGECVKIDAWAKNEFPQLFKLAEDFERMMEFLKNQTEANENRFEDLSTKSEDNLTELTTIIKAESRKNEAQYRSLAAQINENFEKLEKIMKIQMFYQQSIMQQLITKVKQT